MIKEKASDRVILATKKTSDASEKCRADLILLLHALLEQLEGNGNRLILQEGPPVSTLENWEDETYCYLEVKLADQSTPEVDLNVTGGRAFIRLIP